MWKIEGGGGGMLGKKNTTAEKGEMRKGTASSVANSLGARLQVARHCRQNCPSSCTCTVGRGVDVYKYMHMCIYMKPMQRLHGRTGRSDSQRACDSPGQI